MPAVELPKLRVRRKPWNVARIGSKFLDALSEIEAQREPWAQYWDEHNANAVKADGPLWVVLGDSLGQGIGASTPENGFVPAVIKELRTITGEPWRAVNLALTGARVSHVVDMELPVIAAAQLDPIVTTCMIGFNDFIGRTPPSSLERGARRLVDGLPHGALVGRVGTSRFTKRATVLRDAFERGATTGKITIFDPWRWRDGADVMARDRIHLNDKGYGHLGDAIVQAMIGHGVTD